MNLDAGFILGVALAVVSTILAVFLTFRHYLKSSGFRDFTVFILILSLIVATAVTLVMPLSEAPLLPLITVLYINGLWLYGAGVENASRSRFTVNPAASRVFVGIMLLVISSWLAVSAYHVGVALITVLIYVLLGAYRLRGLIKV